MDLAKVAARLRPRTSWEAADLGLLLAQRFFKPIALGWLVCVLPIVVAAAAFAATTSFFWLPLLFVWWLKPLYDRVPLLVLSRAFFGEVPGVKDTARHVFRSWRSGSALADITWRRFSPYRGLTMPVRELERLRGAAATERIGVLLRRHVQAPALWLLILGLGTVLVFVAASISLVTMVIPEAVGFDIVEALRQLVDVETNTPLVEVFAFCSYFVAMSAVEIFYASTCFGLYINRRVRLEGWDIEIVFKKLAARLRRRARSAVETAAMVFLVVFLSLSFGARPAIAQDLPADEPENAPQQAIEEILDDPEFGSTSTEESWELRDDLFDLDSEKEDKDPADMGWLEAILDALGTTFQIVMWIVAGAAILAAIVYFAKKVRPPEDAEQPDEPLAGAQTELVDLQQPRKMTLPVDLVEAAIAHWQRGEHAQSLSALYRGTISGLADGYHIEIDPSMTARECVQKVRDATGRQPGVNQNKTSGPGDYVAELASAWTATVYADRRIGDDEAHALFDSWKHHFRGPKR
jgi:hypothetical protein